MQPTRRPAIFLSLVIASLASAARVFPAQDSQTGSVTGRVMLEGKPAPGVIVVATSALSDVRNFAERMLKQAPSFRAATDSDGRYKIDNLPLGKYRVSAASKVLLDANPGSGDREINITDTTPVEGVDFALQRSGVITGRVTDAEGRPVIAEQITLKTAPKPAPGANQTVSSSGDPTASFFSALGDRMYYTDDRGVYRVFGVRPGRYIVSAGRSEESVLDIFLKRPRRARTYYPGVTQEAAAAAVEVAAGAEVTGIDIRLAVADKGFVVSGRVIDAETRTPVADAVVTYSKAATDTDDDKDDNSDFSLGGSVTTTNARGEFRFESVSPGSYKAEASSIPTVTGRTNFYADPLSFEVQYANVDKLEIKIHRGASISGTVVVENADRPEALTEVVGVMLAGLSTDVQMKTSSQAIAAVSTDMSFQMSGLKPGKVKITALPFTQQKFVVLRVERNGLPVVDGIDVQGNEHITGVRVFLTPATCVLRGHVAVIGGPLPPGATILVSAESPNGDRVSIDRVPTTLADSNGDFVIDDLAPGNYEVVARVNTPTGTTAESARQPVTVSSANPTQTTLVIDLKAKGKDD